MNKGIRRLALLLAFLTLLPVVAFGEETPAAEPEVTPSATQAPAENVSRQCAFKSDMQGFYLKYLRDNDFDTANFISQECPLTVDLKESDAEFLCIGWVNQNVERTVRFYGEEDALLLEATEISLFHDETLPIPEGTLRLEISVTGEEKVGVVEVQLYTEGTLPEPWYYSWETTPEQLDFLVVSTHFDDDVLFLGAAMPIYGAEQGYTGAILYMTYQQRLRLDEALRGAWTMGTRYYPLFAMLPDVYKPEFIRAADFTEEIVTQSLVQYFRQYKPLVIFTQDTNGEYGHWQHIRVVECVLSAANLAADASYDPESASAYGTWQVQKVYCHMYPENKLMLDTRAPLAAFGGLNAFDVATEAYKKHVSQHGYWFYVSDDNKYSIADYGLAFSAIENPGEDAFDGIDETLFAGYVPPTPTPTVEPTPTPTPKPTAVPTPTVEATPPETVQKEANILEPKLIVLSVLGLLLIALFAYVLVQMNRRKNKSSS